MTQRPGHLTTARRYLAGLVPRSERALPDEEWMIDQAVAESFPASDPPASSQPGNTIWKRYAAAEAHRRAQARWWLGLAMIAAGAACATVLLMRRPRRSSR